MSVKYLRTKILKSKDYNSSIYKKKKSNTKFQFYLFNTPISNANVIKFLGLLFDNHPNMGAPTNISSTDVKKIFNSLESSNTKWGAESTPKSLSTVCRMSS